MLNNKHKLVAVAAVCGVAATAAIAIAVHEAMKKHRRRIITRKISKNIDELLEELGSEVNPVSKVGESLLRHKLQEMDGKQLIRLYAITRVAQVAIDLGIDPLSITREQIVQLRERFEEARERVGNREYALDDLLSWRIDELNSVLSYAAGLNV